MKVLHYYMIITNTEYGLGIPIGKLYSDCNKSVQVFLNSIDTYILFLYQIPNQYSEMTIINYLSIYNDENLLLKVKTYLIITIYIFTIFMFFLICKIVFVLILN